MRKVRKKGLMEIVCLLGIFLIVVEADNTKSKRQIFREQVLPALGGKIPDEAFRSDRLALNRLNKEGISVPDGVVLDARQVARYNADSTASKHEVLKVYLSRDGRYVPPEGRFHDSEHKTVETTYIIRMPVQHVQKPASSAQNYDVHLFDKPQGYSEYSRLLPENHHVYKPVIRPLELPSPRFLYHSYYQPSWNAETQLDNFHSGDFGDGFSDKLPFFDHDIITDYQRFLDQYHSQSIRHFDYSRSTNQISIHKYPQKESSGFTNLLVVPETSFSCAGRVGVFADVETKCQVIHECSNWSKISSLCPQGTAYSESNKRCEWWNQVICN